MICNVCGGEIRFGDNVCKYCGNVVNTSKETKNVEITREIEMPPKTSPKNEYTREYVTLYRENRDNSNYCDKCGRPLDGITKKCIVCDAKEVSRRAYINGEFKNREMNNMAQKKKKKKQRNTALLVTLTVLSTIILFLFAIIFAAKIADKWGIGSSNDKSSSVTMTHKPKTTADPNWEAEIDDDDNKNTPEPTEHIIRTPIPESTADPVTERGGEYLYDTHTTLISQEELKELERQEIKYIYWEIYARHGYTFDGELADYFENNHSWYMPTTSDLSKAESRFNDIEKRNIKTIEQYQREQGWR